MELALERSEQYHARSGILQRIVATHLELDWYIEVRFHQPLQSVTSTLLLESRELLGIHALIGRKIMQFKRPEIADNIVAHQVGVGLLKDLIDHIHCFPSLYNIPRIPRFFIDLARHLWRVRQLITFESGLMRTLSSFLP